MKKIMMLAAVAAMLVACGGGGGRPTFGDNEYPVVTVGTSNADMQTTYPATIKGVQDVEIRPKVQGFLTQINVKEGQTVGAGQVLFVIDNETYQAQVRQAQASVNTAQQQVNTAQLTYENTKQLHESKVVGDYELQTSQNTFESAKAGLAQAKAALASAKEMLSFCYVKSPASGVVGTLPFKKGALVISASALLISTDFLSAPGVKVVADNYLMYEGWGGDSPLPTQKTVSTLLGMGFYDAVRENKLERSAIADMGGILTGDQAGRSSDDEIVIYAVGGMPVEDVAWAYDCYQNAKEKKIGTVLPVWDEPELMK